MYLVNILFPLKPTPDHLSDMNDLLLSSIVIAALRLLGFGQTSHWSILPMDKGMILSAEINIWATSTSRQATCPIK